MRKYIVNRENRSCTTEEDDDEEKKKKKKGRRVRAGPVCEACGLSHWTPRRCRRCRGRLRDTITNFGDALSEPALERARAALQAADVVLCLGTSLLVSPARDLLGGAAAAARALVVCNRQRTAFDKRAADTGVRMFGDCDTFMLLLQDALRQREPAPSPSP